METIQSAAIQTKEGVFTGSSHADIHRDFHVPYEKENGEGFITSEGRFVDREQAMNIAKIAHQIKEHGIVNPFFLHSCDLV